MQVLFYTTKYILVYQRGNAVSVHFQKLLGLLFSR